MRQGSHRIARDLPAPVRRPWALRYPGRRRDGLLASLFPLNFGRFLLIGFVGKAIFLAALACGFVIAAAFAAGRQDQVFLYAMPMAGIGFAAYELLAASQVRLLNRTFHPIRPAGVALLVLALSGVWLAAFSFAPTFEHRPPSEMHL